MHEQHVVYRVEENARWNFHPGNPCGNAFPWPSVPRDPASLSFPVNDAIVAEVNSQRLATTQIMAQSKLVTALQQLCKRRCKPPETMSKYRWFAGGDC